MNLQQRIDVLLNQLSKKLSNGYDAEVVNTIHKLESGKVLLQQIPGFDQLQDEVLALEEEFNNVQAEIINGESSSEDPWFSNIKEETIQPIESDQKRKEREFNELMKKAYAAQEEKRKQEEVLRKKAAEEKNRTMDEALKKSTLEPMKISFDREFVKQMQEEEKRYQKFREMQRQAEKLNQPTLNTVIPVISIPPTPIFPFFYQ